MIRHFPLFLTQKWKAKILANRTVMVADNHSYPVDLFLSPQPCMPQLEQSSMPRASTVYCTIWLLRNSTASFQPPKLTIDGHSLLKQI